MTIKASYLAGDDRYENEFSRLLFIIVYCYRRASAKAEGDDTKENVFSQGPLGKPQGITPCLPKVPVADIPETYGLSR